MIYQSAKFLTSVAQTKQLPPDNGREVVFAGRSNAGKSSALNVLTGQRRLAHTSKTPGRTQLINFFTLTDETHRLVDLPGYGYAKVPNAIKKRWQALLTRYLQTRESLCGMILLMDIRHPLTNLDWGMLDFIEARERPIHILLTKSDKLKRGPALSTLAQLRQRLSSHPLVSIQCFSALKRQGVDELTAKLDEWLCD